MIKINLGCGKRNFGKDWDHIDGGNYPHLNSKDIINLPYNDNTVDLLYASHVLEYFDREQARVILKEWKRVLKPNGILRLAVPNFKTMAHLFINGTVPLKGILGPLYGKMIMGNQNIYHKTVYDYDSLKNLLEQANLKEVRVYDWRKTEHSNFDDQSQAYYPHMDKTNGILISLNMECVK